MYIYMYRSIAWQQTAQDKVKWRIGEEAFLLQWNEDWTDSEQKDKESEELTFESSSKLSGLMSR